MAAKFKVGDKLELLVTNKFLKKEYGYRGALDRGDIATVRFADDDDSYILDTVDEPGCWIFRKVTTIEDAINNVKRYKALRKVG